jgi:pimeloyl-ACP methyl ester carboxylesterase
MLATGFAAHNPDRVDKIVLGEPGFLTPLLAKEFGAMVRPKSMLKMIGGLGVAFIKALHIDGPDDQAWLDFFAAELMTETDGDVTPIAGYFCNDDPNTASMPYWRLGASAIFAAQTHETNANGEPMIDMVTGLDRWNGEALILAGECNRLIGPDWQQQNHLPLFRHARLVVISGAGHTMFGERPLESIAVTRAFLNGALATHPSETKGSNDVTR